MGRPRRRHRRTPGAALTLASAALLWAGCSIERDYEVLSFFFDGVPEPAPAMVDGTASGGRLGGTRRMAGGGAVSAHSAYLERRCPECHGDRARFGFRTEGFSALGADVCATCHDAGAGFAHLHGPVALGACLVCHEPHVSEHPLLLVERSPELCLACHGEAMMAAPRTAEHADLSRDCLACHHGHGGDDRSLLRPTEPGG